MTFASGEDSVSILQGFTLQNGTGNDEDPDGNGSYYTYGGGFTAKTVTRPFETASLEITLQMKEVEEEYFVMSRRPLSLAA